MENQEDASQKTIFSISEAAKLNNVSRQAIYIAIKTKKLRATRISTRWTIELKDLEEYKKNKYSRDKSTFEGAPLFDNKNGIYSINQIAKMLNIPIQKIYYAIRIKLINASRKGSSWVINIADVEKYKEEYLNKRYCNFDENA